MEGTDRLTLSYDPGIVHMMRNISELKQVELWNVWEKIKCPVMIVHGEQSDLLSVKTLEEMKKVLFSVFYSTMNNNEFCVMNVEFY